MTYKSPKYSKNTYIENVRSALSGKEKVVLFGDINIDLKVKEGAAFLDLMYSMKYVSVLGRNEITTNGGTHLDICFSNVNGVDSWVYESLYSYHKPICIILPNDSLTR